MKALKLFVIAPFALVGIAAFIALGGVIVQQLWNWLMPAIFGWHQVTLWQALGLLLLCRILFGGSGHRGRYASRWTPEERARFRTRIRERFGARMHERCGATPAAGAGPGQATES